MSSDLIERLADSPVPPLPAEFERGVHERLNRALVIGQMLEFALRAIPYACIHFAKAVAGWIVLSVSGNFPKRQDQNEETPDESPP
jgi:hypothetical protein